MIKKIRKNMKKIKLIVTIIVLMVFTMLFKIDNSSAKDFVFTIPGTYFQQGDMHIVDCTRPGHIMCVIRWSDCSAQ